jgi:hypothetical protein
LAAQIFESEVTMLVEMPYLAVTSDRDRRPSSCTTMSIRNPQQENWEAVSTSWAPKRLNHFSLELRVHRTADRLRARPLDAGAGKRGEETGVSSTT